MKAVAFDVLYWFSCVCDHINDVVRKSFCVCTIAIALASAQIPTIGDINCEWRVEKKISFFHLVEFELKRRVTWWRLKNSIFYITLAFCKCIVVLMRGENHTNTDWIQNGLNCIIQLTIRCYACSCKSQSHWLLSPNQIANLFKQTCCFLHCQWFAVVCEPVYVKFIWFAYNL